MVNGTRRFLFLQGPHGPFFRRLAAELGARGAGVARVVFNAADLAEWQGAGPVHAFTAAPEHYRYWIDRLLARERVTDLVLYGDSRPVHTLAIAAARKRGIRTHILEEGYLRPSWITYEREGSNAFSPLCRVPLGQIEAALGPVRGPATGVPARWGDTRQHLWWSVRYHARLLLPSRRFRNYRGHRDLPLIREVGHYARRVLGAPWQRIGRALGRQRLWAKGTRYHLALLQLSFDCSMRAHSRFATNAAFVEEMLDGFARGAPADHHIVIKAHPFEDGREQIGQTIRRLAARYGLSGRVHFIDGGQALGGLMDRAESVALVNSTAAHQALQRGLPVLALGEAVYVRPELVSTGEAAAFFANPRRPDPGAYRLFRSFLLQTAALPGSFYSDAGIRRALKRLPDAMLDPIDRYQHVLDQGGVASARQCRGNPGQRIVA